MLPLNETDQARFWEMVRKDPDSAEIAPEIGGCWLWIGAQTERGYGKFSANGQTLRAHRVSLEIMSEIPLTDQDVVLHLCDIPNCVRPTHLHRGTTGDNNKDKLMKLRRDFFKRGGDF